MAVEVKENNRDMWVVKLDNESEQITARVEDGEWSRCSNFKRQTDHSGFFFN